MDSPLPGGVGEDRGVGVGGRGVGGGGVFQQNAKIGFSALDNIGKNSSIKSTTLNERKKRCCFKCKPLIWVCIKFIKIKIHCHKLYFSTPYIFET